MPAIERYAAHSHSTVWRGDCPVVPCAESFLVEADPWQEKISVLSALREHRHPAERHAHGQFVVFDDFTHGGE